MTDLPSTHSFALTSVLSSHLFVSILLMVLPSQSIVETLLALHRLMFFILLMFLDLSCNSFPLVRLLTVVLGSFSTLSCVQSVHVHYAWCWPRRHDGLWSLIGLSVLAAASISSFQQWYNRLGHLCSSHLSSLVHHGISRVVSGNTHCGKTARCRAQ
jgi:hypothetical protein